MSPELQGRVLLVDDDENSRILLASLLRQRGLTVDEAVDGEEAIALLRDNVYAVVLLDLLMPRVDGFEVLKAMKNDQVNSPPVVLVVTGADRSYVDRLDPERIHGIIRKPFDARELVALVSACVSIKGGGTLESVALAMISSTPLLLWLQRLHT